MTEGCVLTTTTSHIVIKSLFQDKLSSGLLHDSKLAVWGV